MNNFCGLTVKNLEDAIKVGRLDLDLQYNSSPDMGCYLEFMKKHPKFKAHGYYSDNEIVIEGLECVCPSIDDILDFVTEFRNADDFVVTKQKCYCWFD